MKKDIDEAVISMMIKALDSDNPIENEFRFWINYTKNGFKSNSESGKWCIFSSESTIESKWSKIKKLIDDDKIIHAKVSTKRYLPMSRAKKYIICVYTKNFNDVEDLNKTREALRTVGLNRPLNYKRDIDTMNGIYGKNEYYLKM